MAEGAKKFASAEEYLLFERQAETKHEYIDGEVVAMAGAGLNHNRIVANLIGNFYIKLNGGSCEVFPSDMRLHIPVNSLYTYPDLMIVCGKPEFTDEKKDTITNPVLVVEVLSPSTEDYDRGGKFMRYRSITSIREYLLLDSTFVLAEKFARQPDGTWSLTEYRDIDSTITLQSLELKLNLRELYARVEGL